MEPDWSFKNANSNMSLPSLKKFKSIKIPTDCHLQESKLFIKTWRPFLALQPHLCGPCTLWPPATMPPPLYLGLPTMCSYSPSCFPLTTLIELYIITCLIIRFLHHQTLSFMIAGPCLSCLLSSIPMASTQLISDEQMNKWIILACVDVRAGVGPFMLLKQYEWGWLANSI